jgi:hypothetical protein
MISLTLPNFRVSIDFRMRLTTIDLQAVGQLTSTASMTDNLAQCRLLVKKAVQAGAKVSDIHAPTARLKLEA